MIDEFLLLAKTSGLTSLKIQELARSLSIWPCVARLSADRGKGFEVKLMLTDFDGVRFTLTANLFDVEALSQIFSVILIWQQCMTNSCTSFAENISQVKFCRNTDRAREYGLEGQHMRSGKREE